MQPSSMISKTNISISDLFPHSYITRDSTEPASASFGACLTKFITVKDRKGIYQREWEASCLKNSLQPSPVVSTVFLLALSCFSRLQVSKMSEAISFVRMYEYSCIFPCVISIQQLHSPLSTYCFSEQLICSNISQRHRQLFVMSILFETNNIFNMHALNYAFWLLSIL